jgi:hypothetical protein
MRNIIWVVLTLSLFVMASAGVAYGDGVTPAPGETLDFSGTGSQTSPCCVTGSFVGTLTLGSEIGSSSDWTVTAFDAILDKCGASDCSTLVWSFSLEFDASNDTLFGTASTDFTGSGGDSRKLTIDFSDGNTTSDPFTNNDLTEEGMGNFSNDKSGTVAYVVTPEPATALLLGSGLLLAGLATTRKSRKSVPASMA